MECSYSPTAVLSDALALMFDDSVLKFHVLAAALEGLAGLVGHPDLSETDSASAAQAAAALAQRPCRLDDWYHLVWPAAVVADTQEHLDSCRANVSRLSAEVASTFSLAAELLLSNFGPWERVLSPCGRFSLAMSGDLGLTVLTGPPFGDPTAVLAAGGPARALFLSCAGALAVAYVESCEVKVVRPSGAVVARHRFHAPPSSLRFADGVLLAAVPTELPVFRGICLPPQDRVLPPAWHLFD